MDATVVKRAAKSYCSVESWKNRFPISKWLPKYSTKLLVSDLVAGLTVGLMVIPQSLAYASIAKLPIEYGLYSSYMGCFVYCFLGGAKDVSIGPTAIMSLLVSSYGTQDPHEHTGVHEPSYAILLAFLCGVIQLGLGILRLGSLTGFISASVVAGFTTASAITIAFGQVKHLLGIDFSSGTFAEDVVNTFKNIPQANPWDVLVGAVSIGILVLLMLIRNDTVDWEKKGWTDATTPTKVLWKFLWFLGTARSALVVACGILVSFALESAGHTDESMPITITGFINSTGIPAFKVPNFHLPNIGGVFNIGIALVPIIGYFESIVIGKGFARQSNYKVEPNQELVAIGVCNIASSFVQAYPVTGSFSRTAVNYQSGVRTPAAGIFTGVLVLLALAYLTPLFRLIPEASLAAVIIVALVKLIQLPIMKKLWLINKWDLVPYVATLLASLVLDVAYGTLIGIGVDLIILLYSVSRPSVKVEYSQQPGDLEVSGLHQQLQVDSQSVSVVTVDSSIRYPSVDYISEKVLALCATQDHPTKLVLDFSRVNQIDFTVVQGLSDLMMDLRRAGFRAVFANVLPPIKEQLTRGDIYNLQMFDSIQDAIWSLAEEGYDKDAPS